MLARALLILSLVLAPSQKTSAQERHQAFTRLLAEPVHDGRVNYRALCDAPGLAAYCEQLRSAIPDTISDREARLAFWINAYNAFTLKVICDHYPVASIKDLHFGGRILGTVLKKTVWDRPFIRIGGETYTLNQIEHEIIRPEYGDPRIHFALVCAAVSCPPLRPEAYEGPILDRQLDDQARTFLRDPERNQWNASDRTASLSKILEWYGGDFGGTDVERLLYLATFLPAKEADAIRGNPQAWHIQYEHYDWGLNE